MAGLILCETIEAKEPFIFTNTKVQVYSYEELCYYIYNNQVLITMDMIDGVLLRWIAEEIHLPELRDELLEILEKEGTLEDCLVKILMHKNYYHVDEIREFISKYDGLRLQSPWEREKQIADGYLRYKRYTKAISIYRQLLEDEEKISDHVFLGNAYHNMALAMANDLQLEDAKYTFLKAFTLNESELSLRAYFLVMASYESEQTVQLEMRKYHLPESYYEAIMEAAKDAKEDLSGMQLYHRVQKAIYNRDHGDAYGYSRRMDTVLQEIKDTFREQTI